MATSISQMFVNVINEGIKATQAISEADKKALACAELAKALAMSGLVTVIGSESGEIEASVSEAKESLKDKPKEKKKPAAAAKKEEEKVKKETAPEPEPEPEEAQEESSGEVELVDEWTEEMIEIKSEQLEVIQELQDEYDEETLDECVKNFSEGVLESIEDISPLNIDGFIAYIQLLLSDAEEE